MSLILYKMQHQILAIPRIPDLAERKLDIAQLIQH